MSVDPITMMEGDPGSAYCLRGGDNCPPYRSGTYRLYSNRFCPFCKRILLIATSKYIQLDLVNIDLSDKPSWFVSKNPAGKVPVLEVDGLIVPESTAIADYLEKHFPRPQLVPPNWSAERENVVAHFEKTIPETVHRFLQEPDENLPKMWDTLLEQMTFFESDLAKRGTPYFGGPEFPNLVDLLLWPWFELIPLLPQLCGMSFDGEKFPALYRWMKILEGQPFVYLNAIEPEIVLQFMKEYRKGNFLYDLGLPPRDKQQKK